MADSYDLAKLGSDAFEHLVNALAMRTLGTGHTGFGPGADGGRDGYFEGEAPYPSISERWVGTWYFQSKFHKPHLTKDAQKWLVEQITEELNSFSDPNSGRKWPDIWIVATNIDPSGTPQTGSFDKALAIVKARRPKLANRFHIWGGRKILDLLSLFPDVADYYRHFLTPGHVIKELYNHLQDDRAGIESIIRHFVIGQFEEQQYTKLEQAGSDTETRPGIHKLFIDLPFFAPHCQVVGFIANAISHATVRCHRIDQKQTTNEQYIRWSRHPNRARVWFLKGGPGQGKSTVGQFLSQIQRAALILESDDVRIPLAVRQLAKDVKDAHVTANFWPIVPRIPIFVELKDYAQWYGSRDKNEPKGILTYLSIRISVGVEQEVAPGTLKRALGKLSWLAILDGLDEVPDDVKDSVANQVKHFIDDIVSEVNADLMAICTSRPQGYSGQFSNIDGPTVELSPLDPDIALDCAIPVIKYGRNEVEAQKDIQILRSAIKSEPGTVRELMKTPLQSHIMAVVVREGGKPPDRRWQLFSNFYQVIKRRETNRDLPDRRIAKLLREDHQLLKTVHNRLGFVLHSRAEVSSGAQTSLNRTEFKQVIEQAVDLMIDEDTQEVIGDLMRATTNRLVLVNTPDDGKHVRFDIRSLQEFFAAEFLYDSIDAEKLKNRLAIISGDAHWREVTHFLLSALVENNRLTELDHATQTLAIIDQIESSFRTRLLSRRLAKGALLAARLLQEGVLEQDKRVRLQFRACLEPIAGCLSYNELKSFTKVIQPSSRSWLINFLFDHIREADKTENIGAAALLCMLLNDQDLRASEIKQYLLDAPIEYVVTVLCLYARQLADGLMSANWVQDVCYTILLKENWKELNSLQVRYLIGVLQRSNPLLAVATRNSLLPEHSALLEALIKSGGQQQNGTQPIQCGLIAVTYYKIDWSSHVIECGFYKNELPSDCASATGILHVVFLILRFAKTRLPNDLVSLIKYFANNPNSFDALPGHIRAYVPVDEASPLEYQFSQIISMDENQLVDFISNLRSPNPKILRLRETASLRHKCDIKQWESMIRGYLRLAFLLWGESYWSSVSHSRPTVLDTQHATDALVAKLLLHPKELLFTPMFWGDLISKASKQSGIIRSAICDIAHVNQPTELYFSRVAGSPFKLQLPQESALLPHILACLVFCDEHKQFNAPKRQDIGELIGQYVTSNIILDSIFEDQNSSESVKAAAYIMALLHPNNLGSIRQRAEHIHKIYYFPSGTWLLKSILLCAGRIAKQDEQAAEHIIGEILNRNRSNYYHRQIIEDSLVILRERSTAPINATNVLENWLTGFG